MASSVSPTVVAAAAKAARKAVEELNLLRSATSKDNAKPSVVGEHTAEKLPVSSQTLSVVPAEENLPASQHTETADEKPSASQSQKAKEKAGRFFALKVPAYSTRSFLGRYSSWKCCCFSGGSREGQSAYLLPVFANT